MASSDVSFGNIFNYTFGEHRVCPIINASYFRLAFSHVFEQQLNCRASNQFMQTDSLRRRYWHRWQSLSEQLSESHKFIHRSTCDRHSYYVACRWCCCDILFLFSFVIPIFQRKRATKKVVSTTKSVAPKGIQFSHRIIEQLFADLSSIHVLVRLRRNNNCFLWRYIFSVERISSVDCIGCVFECCRNRMSSDDQTGSRLICTRTTCQND